MGVVLMSKRELNRIDVLARLDAGRLTTMAAADLMRVTVRQTALIASLKAQNHEPDPPAWAAAAAIATSPQRRPRLPQKLPSDILTLQSKGHLNLVATHQVRATAPSFPACPSPRAVSLYRLSRSA
jgi:hypothetical protein